MTATDIPPLTDDDELETTLAKEPRHPPTVRL